MQKTTVKIQFFTIHKPKAKKGAHINVQNRSQV